MNIRKFLSRSSAAVCLAVGLSGFAAANADAANVLFFPVADFSSVPYTITFGTGSFTATYTFTDISATTTDPLIEDAVSTGGDALVNSFASQPIPFQLDTLIGDSGFPTFTAFPTPVGILDSIAEDSIGLEFTLADGIHYGFVTTLGPEVLSYGFNSTPGGFIATIGVPEPATWVMLILGLGVLGAFARARPSRAPRIA